MDTGEQISPAWTWGWLWTSCPVVLLTQPDLLDSWPEFIWPREHTYSFLSLATSWFPDPQLLWLTAGWEVPRGRPHLQTLLTLDWSAYLTIQPAALLCLQFLTGSTLGSFKAASIPENMDRQESSVRGWLASWVCMLCDFPGPGVPVICLIFFCSQRHCFSLCFPCLDYFCCSFKSPILVSPYLYISLIWSRINSCVCFLFPISLSISNRSCSSLASPQLLLHHYTLEVCFNSHRKGKGQNSLPNPSPSPSLQGNYPWC